MKNLSKQLKVVLISNAIEILVDQFLLKKTSIDMINYMLSKLTDLFDTNQVKQFSIIMFLVGAVPLASAYTSQYVFGMHPCVLCLYQRIPFWVMCGLAILVFIIKNPKITILVFWVCIVALLINSGIAFFHTGVEYQWWAGTDGCGTGGLGDTLEELRAKIMGAPAVKCSEPAFVFILSMAGWNVVYCLGIATLMIFSKLSIKVEKK